MNIEIIIPGDPIAQPRPRARAFNGHAQVYNVKSGGIAEYKAAIRLEAARRHPTPPVESALRVDCEFVFSRPKGHFGSGRNAGTLKASAPAWHTTKPDRDNLDKAVLDALRGIVFADDRQVCCGIVQKRYARVGETAKTKIAVSQVDAEQMMLL